MSGTLETHCRSRGWSRATTSPEARLRHNPNSNQTRSSRLVSREHGREDARTRVMTSTSLTPPLHSHRLGVDRVSCRCAAARRRHGGRAPPPERGWRLLAVCRGVPVIVALVSVKPPAGCGSAPWRPCCPGSWRLPPLSADPIHGTVQSWPRSRGPSLSVAGGPRVGHRVGMAGIRLMRNRALDYGRVVCCACCWARRPLLAG